MISINQFEIENVKRIKAVKVSPEKKGLTIVGGKNNQGKSSVLDAIAWALGGDKYRPEKAKREDSPVPPNIHVVLSNGIVVDRKGVNSSLKVTDVNGKKAGQQLLNSFIEQLALDLPKFMNANDKEKADILLQVIGVEDQLKMLEQEYNRLYQDRLLAGRVADQKEKYAKEQPYFPDAPETLISPSEIIKKQQDILARNGENQRKRNHLNELLERQKLLGQKVKDLEDELERYKGELEENIRDCNIAITSTKDLEDESTAELEKNLANIEEINVKVRANMDKDKAEDDARGYRTQYDELTAKIVVVRKHKRDLLDKADLPLPGLSVEDGKLTYNNYPWGNISGSDQLRVATAIVRKLNPDCGFVLMDKLEQMDLETIEDFGEWLQAEGLQAIATRVSSGDECSVIIEDGYVAGEETGTVSVDETPGKAWKAGEF